MSKSKKSNKKMVLAVGSHEPIFHRLRTGNSTAEEWARWEKEVSDENLDTLERLGISRVHIACSKGFGLEYEKPLIERAAVFSEKAKKRGIDVTVYVQGFPVYYETFLDETPEAEDWLAKGQNGEHLVWGGQTFRKYMDPTRLEFYEYEKKILDYILDRFMPAAIFMDNTSVAPVYTQSSLQSFRTYLSERFDSDQALQEFGIPHFKKVVLPEFDPIYFPRDAMRIVKDPILQEWAFWRAKIVDDFVASMRDHVHSRAPKIPFLSGGGCETLRYNMLFNNGIYDEGRIRAMDHILVEESGSRPGTTEPSKERDLNIVMDERHVQATANKERDDIRISTDARYTKILHNYGMGSQLGFWGEHDRAGKLVTLSHNMTFSFRGNIIGSVGPLAANDKMIDDIKDVVAWGEDHLDCLDEREDRIAPIAVWRGTNTLAFIRHRPVWEVNVIEQILFENHYPFTILFDDGLSRFLENRDLLILPGTRCVSSKQIEIIESFVNNGGKLLILGEAGVRDERTRVRTTYAFKNLFGGSLPNLEFIGPPHWVPDLDFSKMPLTLSAEYGKGKVAFVKRIIERYPLDLTRDPYMPERGVMAKDILPPVNEDEILMALDNLLGKKSIPKLDAPRWTLCEYWRRNNDLIVCCANLRKGHDGGPITLDLGPYNGKTATIDMLLESNQTTIEVKNGKVKLKSLPHFAAITIPDVLPPLKKKVVVKASPVL